MHYRVSYVRGASAAGFLVLIMLLAGGCAIKTEVKAPVPPKIAAARTASLQELLALINGGSAGISSLSSKSIKVSLTLVKAEKGTLQEYHNAPGYILLRRPDDILMNVQAPLTKTTIIELVSRGDQFEIWNPRDNKLYVGRNSARAFQLEENGQALSFTARPKHILEAILPQAVPVDQAGMHVSLTAEQDAEAKYYIITLLQDAGGREMRTLRRLWIERSQMILAREETFIENGELAGIVSYSDVAKFDGVSMPREIRIERPIDGYILNLHFNTWSINPDLAESAFALNPPPGAERVILKEKGNGEF